MRTNLLPAILLAGAPNCGKSVLSYLLTQELRRRGVQHYLLRTAPDGEGDWFLEGASEGVRILRMENKGTYTPDLIVHMRQAIYDRRLPLLVDIGGKPQGDQFDILGACTHYILLYKDEKELQTWLADMARLDLLPVAELRSSLTEEETAMQTPEGLQGIISGLVRESPQPGATFGALLTQVIGICDYDLYQLEQDHVKDAPFPVVLERELAVKVQAAPKLPTPWWEPGDLPKVRDVVQPGQALALYGRGPVWLAAALAVHALPAPCAVFDARYAWLPIPEWEEGETKFLNVQIQPASTSEADWVKVKITNQILEPQTKLFLPRLEGERALLRERALPRERAADRAAHRGVILSGKMPRWLYAALARKLTLERPWIAVHVPSKDIAVVIFSRVEARQVGDTLVVHHAPPVPKEP